MASPGTLKEWFQEHLFLAMSALGIARSWIGRRLLVALLFTYKDAGRPGRIWRRIVDHLHTLDDYDLMFQLGYLQLEFGQLDSSIKTCEELLDRDLLRGYPPEARLVANLIEALNQSEDCHRAIGIFESLSNTDLSEPTGILQFNVGNSYLDAGRLEEAVRCYQTALCMRDADGGIIGNANECHILHNLGNCYYRMDDSGKALKSYRDALEHAVTSLELGMEELAIGDAYFTMDRHDEAKIHYTRAGEHGHGKAKQRLADVAEDLEQRKGGRERDTN